MGTTSAKLIIYLETTIFVFLTILPLTIMSQNTKVKGCIQNECGEIIEGVYISTSATVQKNFSVSDKRGIYEISIPLGTNTLILFQHLSYHDTAISIIGNTDSATIHLNIVMKEKSMRLNTVSIIGESVRTEQRGDTTVFFANAYKVSDDASAYDIITEKLPGVSIRDGQINVAGENVTGVYLDGKEYYGNDVVLALKNIPASIVNEIQVFDKNSEYAKVVGFDDTNKKRVINIGTKNSDSTTTFSKLAIGYGSEQRFDIYGNFNLTNKRQQLSLFTQHNNINKQDFSLMTPVSADGQNTPSLSPYEKGTASNPFMSEDNKVEDLSSINDGISLTNAAGINYATSIDNRLSVNAHYLFSLKRTSTCYDIEDTYFNNGNDSLLSNPSIIRRQNIMSDKTNHRMYANMEYHLSKKNTIFFTPMISYLNKKDNSFVNIIQRDDNLSTKQLKDVEKNSLFSAGDLTFVHKIGRGKNIFSLNLKLSYMNDNETDRMLTIIRQNDSISISNGITNKNNSHQIDGIASYIFSLNRSSKIKIDAICDYLKSTNSITTTNSDSLHDCITNNFICGDVFGENTGIGCKVSYLLSYLGINMVTGVELKETKSYIYDASRYVTKNHTAILPFMLFKYRIDIRNQIHFKFNSQQIFPSIEKLQESVVNIDPLLSIKGNMNLIPSYSHNTSLRWMHNNTNNNSIFIIFMKYNIKQHYIATQRRLATMPSTMLTQQISYLNTEQLYSSADLLLAYGFPFKLIKSNVNVSSFISHAKTPGFYNDILTFNSVTTWSGAVTIGSNISEKIDFVADVNVKYNNDQNNTLNQLSVKYWTLSYGGQIKTNLLPWLKLKFECGHTGYYGLWTKKYNAVICNASVSVLCGKKKNIEFETSVHDIFNQNNNFYSLTTEIYKRNTDVNVLKRYLLLSLIYKIKP